MLRESSIGQLIGELIGQVIEKSIEKLDEKSGKKPGESMSQSKQIIPILDLFRLIAALLVALAHYEIVFGQYLIYGSMASTALSWFFVLSGFIIAYNYPSLSGAATYRRYYLHRLIRIYPVYALAVLISGAFVTIGYLQIGEGFFGSVRRPFELSYDLPEQKDIGFWLMAIVRHLTFTQSISSIETLKLVFDGPLWSLVLEVVFYLFFPLFLVLLKPVNTMGRVIAALVVGYLLQYLLILAFLPEAESYDVMNLQVPVYTNPLIRGIEFIFGMLIYRAYSLMPTPVAANNRNWGLLLLGMLAYVLVNHLGAYVPYQFAMFYTAVPVVTFLVFILTRVYWQPDTAIVKFCAWCGGMSYVLYCFHWPLMEIVQFTDIIPPSLPVAVHVGLLLLLYLVFCHVVLRFVESPTRKWLYRRLDKPASTD